MAITLKPSEVPHVRGAVLPSGEVRDVFVVDRRVTFEPQENAVTLHDGGFLVPGLVDCHAHLALASPAGDAASVSDRIRASAQVQLEVGVLALREPGSPAGAAARDLGPRDGLPRTFVAGNLLARTGRYFPGLGREVEPDELPDAAAEEAAASGAWVKVIADFLAPGGSVTPAFPAEALAEAATRAHAAGARITAHATCRESIDACIAAGFDSIEHATFLEPDQIDALLEAGTALVPTLLIADGVLEAMRAFGGDAAGLAESRRRLDLQPAIVAEASARGVPILAGTDAGMVPHGLVGREIGLLLAAGLAPQAALGAGSWVARGYLGLPGIEEGAPADIVVFDDDPGADPSVLTRPALIMLDGVVHEATTGQ